MSEGHMHRHPDPLISIHKPKRDIPTCEVPITSGRSLHSAKLAAYGESRARGVVEVDRRGQDDGYGEGKYRCCRGYSVMVFFVGRHECVGQSGCVQVGSVEGWGWKPESPRVRDGCVLEQPPRSTNPSRSRIRQSRRPNTSSLILIFVLIIILYASYQLIFPVSSSRSLGYLRTSGLLVLVPGIESHPN